MSSRYARNACAGNANLPSDLADAGVSQVPDKYLMSVIAHDFETVRPSGMERPIVQLCVALNSETLALNRDSFTVPDLVHVFLVQDDAVNVITVIHGDLELTRSTCLF